MLWFDFTDLPLLACREIYSFSWRLPTDAVFDRVIWLARRVLWQRLKPPSVNRTRLPRWPRSRPFLRLECSPHRWQLGLTPGVRPLLGCGPMVAGSIRRRRNLFGARWDRQDRRTFAAAVLLQVPVTMHSKMARAPVAGSPHTALAAPVHGTPP